MRYCGVKLFIGLVKSMVESPIECKPVNPPFYRSFLQSCYLPCSLGKGIASSNEWLFHACSSRARKGGWLAYRASQPRNLRIVTPPQLSLTFSGCSSRTSPPQSETLTNDVLDGSRVLFMETTSSKWGESSPTNNIVEQANDRFSPEKLFAR